jgi:sensor histidine kinase YesM
VNVEGTVISAADGITTSRSIAGETFFEEIRSGKSAGPQHYVSQEETRFCVPIPQLSAWLVAVPDAGVLNTVQSSFSGMLVTALGFILGCSMLAAVFLSRGIVKPIHKLAAAMKKARNGNFSVRCDVGGPDEIRYLGSTFNALMDDIERYVAEVTQKEKEKRAYELRFLQAQINPHLLYNSLDSVLAYLASNDTRHAEEILMQLSGFFKIALHRGGAFVELGHEVEHVKKYMELQRLCRGKMIDLQVNIPENLLHMPMMRTTLQPIVENSFMHAFLGSVNDGTICIEAKTIEDGRYVALSVTDDGLGMDADSIRNVMAGLDTNDFPAEKGGFGLKNVNRRLRTYDRKRAGGIYQSDDHPARGRREPECTD